MSHYDPEWREAQNLATRRSKGKSALALCTESLKVADRCSDAYQRVAVKSWPIRSLIQMGEIGRVMKCLPAMFQDVKRLEEKSRRVDALFLVYKAVINTPADAPVLNALLAEAAGCEHWKCSYLVCRIVGIVHQRDPVRALAIAESMPPGRFVAKH